MSISDRLDSLDNLELPLSSNSFEALWIHNGIKYRVLVNSSISEFRRLSKNSKIVVCFLDNPSLTNTDVWVSELIVLDLTRGLSFE